MRIDGLALRAVLQWSQATRTGFERGRAVGRLLLSRKREEISGAFRALAPPLRNTGQWCWINQSNETPLAIAFHLKPR